MTPPVSFHYNLADKYTYAYGLVKNWYQNKRWVVVWGSAEELAMADRVLWMRQSTAFIPHGYADKGMSWPQVTASLVLPIVLGGPPSPLLEGTVLLNLGKDFPALPLTDFQEIHDLAGQDDTEKQAGRARWKQYQAEGHSIQAQDAGLA